MHSLPAATPRPAGLTPLALPRDAQRPATVGMVPAPPQAEREPRKPAGPLGGLPCRPTRHRGEEGVRKPLRVTRLASTLPASPHGAPLRWQKRPHRDPSCQAASVHSEGKRGSELRAGRLLENLHGSSFKNLSQHQVCSYPFPGNVLSEKAKASHSHHYRHQLPDGEPAVLTVKEPGGSGGQ